MLRGGTGGAFLRGARKKKKKKRVFCESVDEKIEEGRVSTPREVERRRYTQKSAEFRRRIVSFFLVIVILTCFGLSAEMRMD